MENKHLRKDKKASNPEHKLLCIGIATTFLIAENSFANSWSCQEQSTKHKEPMKQEGLCPLEIKKAPLSRAIDEMQKKLDEAESSSKRPEEN